MFGVLEDMFFLSDEVYDDNKYKVIDFNTYNVISIDGRQLKDMVDKFTEEEFINIEINRNRYILTDSMLTSDFLKQCYRFGNDDIISFKESDNEIIIYYKLFGTRTKLNYNISHLYVNDLPLASIKYCDEDYDEVPYSLSSVYPIVDNIVKLTVDLFIGYESQCHLMLYVDLETGNLIHCRLIDLFDSNNIVDFENGKDYNLDMIILHCYSYYSSDKLQGLKNYITKCKFFKNILVE